MKVSVVIPQFNGWNLTHSLLFDLYNFCRGIDEVLLVDNGSTEKDGRDWWLGNNMLPLRVLRLDGNIGFLKAANYGMQKAKGDILILISNDVSIKVNILPFICDKVKVHHSIVGGRYLDWDTGWNAFDGVVYPYLEGWLLACHKQDWMELGGFDERFSPNDYEDIDFSTQAVSQGFALVGLDSPKVTHLGAQSIKYGPEREALTKTNREKFREKWLNQK